MSPEQIRGEDVSPATDIYALGCVMFEVLTGTPPFGGRPSMRVLFAHLQEPPPDLSATARRHHAGGRARDHAGAGEGAGGPPVLGDRVPHRHRPRGRDHAVAAPQSAHPRNALSQAVVNGPRALVLDEDGELAELVPPSLLENARQASVATTVELDTGQWDARVDSDRAREGYGLLALDGVLVRRVGYGGRYGAELLAAGDLLRPWEFDGDETIGFETTWRVLSRDAPGGARPRLDRAHGPLHERRARPGGPRDAPRPPARRDDGDRPAAAARRAPVDAVLGARRSPRARAARTACTSTCR